MTENITPLCFQFSRVTYWKDVFSLQTSVCAITPNSHSASPFTSSHQGKNYLLNLQKAHWLKFWRPCTQYSSKLWLAVRLMICSLTVKKNQWLCFYNMFEFLYSEDKALWKCLRSLRNPRQISILQMTKAQKNQTTSTWSLQGLTFICYSHLRRSKAKVKKSRFTCIPLK